MISGNEVQIRLSQEGLYRGGRRRSGAGLSATAARLGAVHHPMLRILRGLRMTARAETSAHAELRSRLLGVILLTVVVDVLASMLAWTLERHHGELTSLGNALFWTTTQMLTVSSQFPNPLTTGGKILDVFLEIYALVVVTSVAGVFASFFHHRYRDRTGQE
jgi:hypothetical protein